MCVILKKLHKLGERWWNGKGLEWKWADAWRACSRSRCPRWDTGRPRGAYGQSALSAQDSAYGCWPTCAMDSTARIWPRTRRPRQSRRSVALSTRSWRMPRHHCQPDWSQHRCTSTQAWSSTFSLCLLLFSLFVLAMNGVFGTRKFVFILV